MFRGIADIIKADIEAWEKELVEDDNKDASEENYAVNGGAGGKTCLCKQFEHDSFCRCIAEEAHVECWWWGLNPSSRSILKQIYGIGRW